MQRKKLTKGKNYEDTAATRPAPDAMPTVAKVSLSATLTRSPNRPWTHW